MNLFLIPNLDKENTINVVSNIRNMFPSGENVLLYQQIYQQQLLDFGDVFDDNIEYLLEAADIVVAIGGDGTIIHSAKLAAEAGKPIIGINSGHLGFTAELEPAELELLHLLKKSDFTIERRMMLEVRVVSSDGDEKLRCNAINDAVINRGALARIINLQISVDGRQSLSYRADGLIISTPTGSTAYALSAGGPIISPLVNCIPITPICPHELSARTIILDENALISIGTGTRGSSLTAANDVGKVYLTVDGETSCELDCGDCVEIKRSPITATFIKLKNISFPEILKSKLNY